MALSKRSKGMSGGAWRVLEEDAVLLCWRELLHGCMGTEAGEGSGAEDGRFCARQKMKSFAPLSRMRQRNETSKREQHVCAGEGNPNVRASWHGRLWLPYGERMQESKVA